MVRPCIGAWRFSAFEIHHNREMSDAIEFNLSNLLQKRPMVPGPRCDC